MRPIVCDEDWVGIRSQVVVDGGLIGDSSSCLRRTRRYDYDYEYGGELRVDLLTVNSRFIQLKAERMRLKNRRARGL